MLKTWVASDPDPQSLARAVEVHLNEFAGDVVSVSYAVDGEHHVLVVYHEIDAGGSIAEMAAIVAAEDIIDDAVAET